ncbi:PIN domain-containing protein [Rhizobium sp.]
MIGVDTNVLLRFLVEDDADQCAEARAFMSQRSENSPVFISSVVLAETVWLLDRRLAYPMVDIIGMIRTLLAVDGVLLEYADELDAWLNGESEPQGDISDNIIAWAGLRVGCTKTVTFDRRAAKTIPGMELLQ